MSNSNPNVYNFCSIVYNQAGKRQFFFHLGNAGGERAMTLPLNIKCSLIVATMMLLCALNGYINLVK